MLVSIDTFANTLFYLCRLTLKIKNKLFHLYLPIKSSLRKRLNNLQKLSNHSLNPPQALDNPFLSYPLTMELQPSKDRQHLSKINRKSALSMSKSKRRSTSTTMRTKRRQNNCDLLTFYAINYISCYY